MIIERLFSRCYLPLPHGGMFANLYLAFVSPPIIPTTIASKIKTPANLKKSHPLVVNLFFASENRSGTVGKYQKFFLPYSERFITDSIMNIMPRIPLDKNINPTVSSCAFKDLACVLL